MSERTPTDDSVGGQIIVRYWASLRAAAGLAQEQLALTGETTLDAVVGRLQRRHRGDARFAEVLATCSVLVGDHPVASRDPETVPVRPGDTIEFLPPFAGG